VFTHIPRDYRLRGYLSDEKKTPVNILHFKGFKQVDDSVPQIPIPDDPIVSLHRRNDRKISFELLEWLCQKTIDPDHPDDLYNVWTPPPMTQFRCHQRSHETKSHQMEYKEACVSFTCSYRKCVAPWKACQYLEPLRLSTLLDADQNNPHKHKLTREERQSIKRHKSSIQ
jgi:hypothetical protein